MSEQKNERRPRKYDGTASVGISGKSSGSGTKFSLLSLLSQLTPLFGAALVVLVVVYFLLAPSNERLASMEDELSSTRQMLKEIEAETDQFAARYDEHMNAQAAADTYWIKLGVFSDEVSGSSFGNLWRSDRAALFSSVDQREWARCIAGNPIEIKNSISARVLGSLNVRAIPTGPSEALGKLHATLSSGTEVEVFEFRCLSGWIWGRVRFGEG